VVVHALGVEHLFKSLISAPLNNKSLRRGVATKAWPYAPRSARYRLVEIREAIGSTPTQFATAVSALFATEAPINQHQLLQMEAGWALVPTQVLASAERLHDDHKAELERQAAAMPATVLVGGDYPYQEPMEGQDYQIAPPRYLGAVGGNKAMSRENRKDELVFLPHKVAPTKLADYLEQAKGVLASADGPSEDIIGRSTTIPPLRWSEEVALSILHDLRYNVDASLNALRHCVLWTQPPPDDTPTKALGRAASANSVLWLQRLREYHRRRHWSDGEKEALDAGITAHGKELAVIYRGQKMLREKTLPQLIEMYYVAGWRHQSP